MEARHILVLSVFTLALWSHVITAMQITPAEEDELMGDESKEILGSDEDDSSRRGVGVDLGSILTLEQYLYDVRNKLDRAHQLYDNTDDGSRTEPEAAYHVITNTKRAALSTHKKLDRNAFFGARGRRTNRAMLTSSQDGGHAHSGRQGDADLLRLLDYYDALQSSKRTLSVSGQRVPPKRQGPPRGFHAVRGKRSQAVY